MTSGHNPGIRIGVQPGTKVFRLERNEPQCTHCNGTMACFHDSELRKGDALIDGCHFEGGSWAVWINPSPDFTQGTYIKLHDNGMVERVTLFASGYEDIWLIKPAT